MVILLQFDINLTTRKPVIDTLYVWSFNILLYETGCEVVKVIVKIAAFVKIW